MAVVTVTITGKQSGRTFISPYNQKDGSQGVLYVVPCFEVQIKSGGTYRAVRFGLQNKGTVEEQRVCDAGLSHAPVCTPAWIDNYRPHSFTPQQRSGAWRLLPNLQFLIHEGADPRKMRPDGSRLFGGSLGCVEIVDSQWSDFLDEIERLAEAPAPTIGAKQLLKVVIEMAPFPTAVLIHE
jgi:hypothetical protein